MKFINSERIKENEKKFINTINTALDWEAIGKRVMEKHHFTLREKIACEKGDLVVFNDTIAYKFDFEIKVPFSVMVNRQGECLEISTPGKEDKEQAGESLFQDVDTDVDTDVDPDAAAGEKTDPAMNPEHERKVAQMASNIAEMISEINQGDEE